MSTVKRLSDAILCLGLTLVAVGVFLVEILPHWEGNWFLAVVRDLGIAFAVTTAIGGGIWFLREGHDKRRGCILLVCGTLACAGLTMSALYARTVLLRAARVADLPSEERLAEIRNRLENDTLPPENRSRLSQCTRDFDINETACG